MCQMELVEGNDESLQNPDSEFQTIGGNTISLLFQLYKPICHADRLVVLNSSG